MTRATQDQDGAPGGAAGDRAADRPPGPAHGAVTDVTDVLARALRALGKAGRPVQASRLAARAWWLLRDDWPGEAEHINGTMHYLARLPAEPATTPTPAGPDGRSRDGEDGRKLP